MSVVLASAAGAAEAPDPVIQLLGPAVPPKAIVIGDSIARGGYGGAGFTATDTFTFHLFAEGIFVTTMAHNFGTATRLPAYNDSLEEQNVFDPWRFTLLMLGTNDYSLGHTLDELATTYGLFLDTAIRSPWYQNPHMPQTIFCVTPLVRWDERKINRAGYGIEDVRAVIREVCERRGLPVIDGPDLLPDPGRLRRDVVSAYYTDGLHLNGRGHRLVAQQLLVRALNYFAVPPDPPPMASPVAGFVAPPQRCRVPVPRKPPPGKGTWFSRRRRRR